MQSIYRTDLKLLESDLFDFGQSKGCSFSASRLIKHIPNPDLSEIKLVLILSRGCGFACKQAFPKMLDFCFMVLFGSRCLNVLTETLCCPKQTSKNNLSVQWAALIFSGQNSRSFEEFSPVIT